MGFLDSLFGNASEIPNKALRERLAPILVRGEGVRKGFRVDRDLFVFTDKRLVLVDTQEMAGSKVDFRSIPYSSVTTFSVVTADNFDRDSELKIWVRGQAAPITKQFGNKSNIGEVAQVLGTYVLMYSRSM